MMFVVVKVRLAHIIAISCQAFSDFLPWNGHHGTN